MMRQNEAILVVASLTIWVASLGIARNACAQGSSDGQAQSGSAQSLSTEPLRLSARETLVDVTVTDAKGEPVHGLPRSAFTIFEDGKPQPIRSFQEIGKATPMVTRLPPKLPPHVYTNIQPAIAGNAINILLLDGLNTGPQDQIFVKQETVKYIKTMPPGTRLVIMTLGSQLRILQGLTSDPEVLLAAVNSKKNRALPSPFTDADTGDMTDSLMDLADADSVASLMQFQNEQAAFQQDIKKGMTLEALDQIAAYLSGVKGRKNLIWFTGGIPMQMFPTGGTNDLASMSDYTRDLRKTTDQLTAAQVAVYPVDARGLVNNPANSAVNAGGGFANGHGDSMGKSAMAFSLKTGAEHLSMEAVAEATGGKPYYNTNDLKDAVNKAVENGSNYYTISYVPPSLAYDGSFHKISVKLNVSGYHLSYRQGYYADDVANNAITPGLTLATKAPEPYGSNMQASMGRGVPTSSQLLFNVRLEPHSDGLNPPETKVLGTLDPKLAGKPLRRYDLQYVFPGRQITFTAGPDGTHKASLEFDLVAYDVYGKVITTLSQTIDLSLKPDRYELIQKQPFQLLQAVDLPLGEMFVRVGVLDAVSDKVGTMEIPLTVDKKPETNPAPAAAKPGG
jgi:VWFA-related protein